jgi:ribosomal-protein-alanine N-acetyltransferase
MHGLLNAIPLATSRLFLRLFNEGDSEALYEIQRDPLVTRYAGGTRSRAESGDSLRRIIARTSLSGFGPLAVEHSETGRVIGWCGVQELKGTKPRYEVIYAFKVNHWGNGYATEAASALIRCALYLMEPSIEEIWGVVYPQNVRSIRVLEKLGMEFYSHELDDKAQQLASFYVVSRKNFLAGNASQSS